MKYIKQRDDQKCIEVSLTEHKDGVDVVVGNYVILTILNAGYVEKVGYVSSHDTGLETDDDKQVVIYDEGEHD